MKDASGRVGKLKQKKSKCRGRAKDEKRTQKVREISNIKRHHKDCNKAQTFVEGERSNLFSRLRWINIKSEWVSWLLEEVIHCRPHGNNRTSLPQIEWKKNCGEK